MSGFSTLKSVETSSELWPPGISHFSSYPHWSLCQLDESPFARFCSFMVMAASAQAGRSYLWLSGFPASLSFGSAVCLATQFVDGSIKKEKKNIDFHFTLLLCYGQEWWLHDSEIKLGLKTITLYSWNIYLCTSWICSYNFSSQTSLGDSCSPMKAIPSFVAGIKEFPNFLLTSFLQFHLFLFKVHRIPSSRQIYNALFKYTMNKLVSLMYLPNFY